MTRAPGPSLLFLAALLATSACSSCDEARPGSEEAEPESPAEGTRDDLVTLRGVVRLAEGTELPLFPEATLREGASSETPGECPPPRTRDRMPVRLGDARGLSNLVITVSDRVGGYEDFVEALGPWDPVQHEVTIRGCRLDPPVLAAAVGDQIVLKNESTYPFMPTMGRSGFMQALLPDEPRVIDLEQGGVQSIRCGFTAPCGRTDVVVAYTPVHTLTAEHGRFELHDVPIDRELRVHAWHPLFQEATVDVTSAADSEELVLTIEPAPQPEAPAAPTGDPGVRPEDSPGLF